jgi:hypothetical protein
MLTKLISCGSCKVCRQNIGETGTSDILTKGMENLPS